MSRLSLVSLVFVLGQLVLQPLAAALLTPINPTLAIAVCTALAALGTAGPGLLKQAAAGEIVQAPPAGPTVRP